MFGSALGVRARVHPRAPCGGRWDGAGPGGAGVRQLLGVGATCGTCSSRAVPGPAGRAARPGEGVLLRPQRPAAPGCRGRRDGRCQPAPSQKAQVGDCHRTDAGSVLSARGLGGIA